MERTKSGKISGSVRVNVKLAPSADRQEVIKTLSGMRGIRTVIKTFPNEPDQELASLYIFEVDPPNLKSILQRLRRNPSVEYAEQAASRRLIW